MQPESGQTLPPAVLLMGPTAAGKTDLAVELVARFPFEIVSVDSAMIYKGMDIGTAKPGPDILARAPHRLIDFLDPAEAYSAARFRADAKREMAAITAAGRIPLLVGGTMLYFRAVAAGLSDLPSASPGLRAEIEAEAVQVGWAALHERMAAVDPELGARIHPNDAQRIQRALEIIALTGAAPSTHFRAREAEPLPYRFIKLAVAPADREILHARIEARLHTMVDQGLVAEVESLRRRGDLDMSHPAVRAVGYRQFWEHLDGRYDRTEATRRAVVATRRFAKRQLTWLRGEPGLEWFDASLPELTEKVADFVRAGLENSRGARTIC